jgi:hypothetical protein
MSTSKDFSNFSSKNNLKTIKCECGLEILLIPDLAEMGRAIEFHANEHQKKTQTAKEGKEIFNRIQDLLLKQVLKKAALQDRKK